MAHYNKLTPELTVDAVNSWFSFGTEVRSKQQPQYATYKSKCLDNTKLDVEEINLSSRYCCHLCLPTCETFFRVAGC